MSIYDTQEATIKRQRMIAAALRESGNIAPEDVTRSAGGYVIPVSPWQAFGKILNSGVGALGDMQATKEEDKLSAQKRTDAADWLRGMNQAGTYQDPLQPVQPTGMPQVPAAPTPQDTAGLTNWMQNRDTNQQAGVAQAQSDAAARKPMMIAQYLKGLDLGGVPAALSQQGLERTMTPKIYDPVKLGEGDILADPNTGATLATGQPKTYKDPVADRALVDIVDPKSPNGYKTIRRDEWEAQGRPQTYHKPEQNNTGVLTDQQETQAQQIAKGVYAYRIPMPALSTRNPIPGRVNELVLEMANRDGEDYRAFEYNARNKALGSFSGGPQGNTVKSFNAFIDHLDTLESAYNQLGNGDIQVVNYWKNYFKTQMGSGAPTTPEALQHAVKSEMVKAVSGGPGAESDRMHAMGENVNNAASPEQIHTALHGVRQLAGGQLRASRQYFTGTTHLSEGRFNHDYLEPASRKLMEELDAEKAGTGKDTTKTKVPPGTWHIEEVK